MNVVVVRVTQLLATAIHPVRIQAAVCPYLLLPPPLRETYGGGSACPALTAQRPRGRDLEITLTPNRQATPGRTLTY